MQILTRILEEHASVSWVLVFDPDDLNLYIGKAASGMVPDPVKGFTVEDFLVTLPENTLHRKAHARFVGMITELLRA